MTELLDSISKIVTFLDLRTIVVGVIALFIACWRIWKVYRLRRAREETRESIGNEIRFRHPNIDDVTVQAYRSDLERGYGISSPDKVGIWVRFAALFRKDPTVQNLEDLEHELRNLGVEEFISRQNAASPTADGSGHRDEGNNFPADATSQPDDFVSYDLSGSNSTGTESVGTGSRSRTGNLRQRTVDLDLPVSQSE